MTTNKQAVGTQLFLGGKVVWVTAKAKDDATKGIIFQRGSKGHGSISQRIRLHCGEESAYSQCPLGFWNCLGPRSVLSISSFLVGWFQSILCFMCMLALICIQTDIWISKYHPKILDFEFDAMTDERMGTFFLKERKWFIFLVIRRVNCDSHMFLSTMLDFQIWAHGGIMLSGSVGSFDKV